MADFSDKMKKAWLKSMEAIGNTAGNIASNTRYKVNEMTAAEPPQGDPFGFWRQSL